MHTEPGRPPSGPTTGKNVIRPGNVIADRNGRHRTHEYGPRILHPIQRIERAGAYDLEMLRGKGVRRVHGVVQIANQNRTSSLDQSILNLIRVLVAADLQLQSRVNALDE